MFAYIVLTAIFILVFLAITFIAGYYFEKLEVDKSKVEMHNKAIDLQFKKLNTDDKPPQPRIDESLIY